MSRCKNKQPAVQKCSAHVHPVALGTATVLLNAIADCMTHLCTAQERNVAGHLLIKGLNQMCSKPGNVRASSIDSIIGDAPQKQAKSKSNSTRQQAQTTSLVIFIEQHAGQNTIQ
jgi:hypothetical protein